MKSRGAAFALLHVSVTLAFASRASADDSKEAARKAFEEASAAYARGEFRAAASAYELAARTRPHATTLLAAADAWEHAGERVLALEACDRAIELASISATERRDADACITRLEGFVVTLELAASDSRTTIAVDGRTARVGARVRLAAGVPHRVRVEAPAGPKSASVEARGGDRCTLRISEQSTPGPVPAGSWVALGAAVTSLAVGTWAGVHLLSIHGADERTKEMVDDFNHLYVPVFDVAAASLLVSAGAGGYLFATRAPLRETLVDVSCTLRE